MFAPSPPNVKQAHSRIMEHSIVYGDIAKSMFFPITQMAAGSLDAEGGF